MIPSALDGLQIITDAHMVMPGTPYWVPRTWRERLFTRPWRPTVKMRLHTPMVPSTQIFNIGNRMLVMHPEMAHRLRQMIDGQTRS